MTGCPGSGKTMTAYNLNCAIPNSIVICRDNLKAQNYRTDCLNKYSYFNGDVCDRKFFDSAKEFLNQFDLIVLDATFRLRSRREQALRLARKQNCDFLILHCVCSYSVLVQRLRQRMCSGQSHLIKSPEEVIEYYVDDSEHWRRELSNKNFIQFDTSKNEIVWQCLNKHSESFVEQIIEILKKPFNPESKNKLSAKLHETDHFIKEPQVAYL